MNGLGLHSPAFVGGRVVEPAQLTHEDHYTVHSSALASAAVRTINFTGVPDVPKAGERVFMVMVGFRDTGYEGLDYLRLEAQNADSGTFLMTRNVSGGLSLAWVVSGVYTLDASGTVTVTFETATSHSGGFTVSLYVLDHVQTYQRAAATAEDSTGTTALDLTLPAGGDGTFAVWINSQVNGAGAASVVSSDLTYEQDVGFDVGTDEWVTVQNSGVEHQIDNPVLTIDTNEVSDAGTCQHVGLALN